MNLESCLKHKSQKKYKLQCISRILIQSKLESNIIECMHSIALDLIDNLVKYDQINCLVMDLSIYKDSIYMCLNHDKAGMKQSEFRREKKQNNEFPILSSVAKKNQ